MENKEKSFLASTWQHFFRKILAGIATIIPLGITVLILWWVFVKVDGLLSPLVTKYLIKYFDRSIPGVGFILMIILLYLLGLFSTNYLGGRVIKLLEKLLMKTPVVKWVYNTVKQIVDTLSMPGKQAFQRVVLISLLGSDMRVLGFVTGSSISKDGAKYIHVFVPTAPNPTSGYLELLRPEQLTETTLTVEEAIKIILSGGVITPEKIG